MADHVLLGRAGSIVEAGERLRARLDPGAIAEAVALVPAAWCAGGDDPEAYVEYLTRRLSWDGFTQEVERARADRV